MQVIVYSVVVFIIGICFGSFFNVVGYRLPKKMSISFPSSHCVNCKHKLTAFELIPIFSYIFQKGKCKHCNTKISIIYPIFELLTGILFVLCYLSYKEVYPELLNIIISCVFASSIVIIMISDIKYMIIPDEILVFFSIIIIILKVLISYKLGNINSLMSLGYEILFMFIDAFIVFCIMYLIRLFGNMAFKKDSMGGGDIKLMSYISLLIGWKLSIIVIFLASFLALPISIYNMYKKNEHMLPFGPYLGLAAVILVILKVDFTTILNLLLY